MTKSKEQCSHDMVKTSLTIVSHDFDGEPEYDYTRVKVNTYEDIDLHRFRCTQCNQTFYYSERARQFFEQGIESDTYGLTTFNLLKFSGIIPKNYRDM